MCGIFGFWDTAHQDLDLKVIKQAVHSIRHRGPDDEGYLLFNTGKNNVAACGGAESDPSLNLPDIERFSGQDYDLAFGFRRLSILDITPAGHQPMSYADGRYWIVNNGEVYNYLELRAELIQRGYQFISGTDTEVILAAYDCWGKQALNRFVGMFAFVILDRQERRLFVARDFFGIKPFYYTYSDGKFSFASEIKALLQLPQPFQSVEPRALYHYLRYGVMDHAGYTFFEGIQQLPPAHYMEIDLDKPFQAVPVQYWDVSLDSTRDISFEEAAQQFREMLLDNIGLHLRSDVPVGSALSGGLDSSSIVMGMRQIMGDNLDLYSFSYIAQDSHFNEEKWIDLAGKSAQARVHKTYPVPEELISDIDHLITLHDEPFGSTSIYAQHRVFKLAHENGIKVMQDGQGADEILGGYLSYFSDRMMSLIRSGDLVQAVKFANAISKSQGKNIGFMTLGLLARGLFPAPVVNLLRKTSRRNPSWLNEKWFQKRGITPFRNEKSVSKDHLRNSLYSSLTRSSLPMLLRYEDRNSMAFSIESRVPFLTPSLVQFVFSLPESYLISSDAISKRVLRKAMLGIVPDPILDRRDKIGFATPELQWLTSQRPWVEKVLTGETARSIAALDFNKIQLELDAIYTGKKPFDFRLWRWINLVRWADHFGMNFDH